MYRPFYTGSRWEIWLSKLLYCVSRAQSLKAIQMPLSTNKIHFEIQKEHESKEGEGRKEMEADQKRWNDIWKVWKLGEYWNWINCKKILKDAEIQEVWCKYLQADRKQGDGPVSWWNEHISSCSPQPLLLPNEPLTDKLGSSTNSWENAEKYSDGHLRYLLIDCTWAAVENKMLQKKNTHSLTSLFVEWLICFCFPPSL